MSTDVPIDVVVDALAAGNVEYVLIGGAAMMLHGCAYTTDDVDICSSRETANVALLVAALAPFIWDVRTVLNGSNVTLSTEAGDVDILGTVTGLGEFEMLRKFAKQYRVGDRVIPMLTLEGLIVAKRAAGRTKDLLALPELEVMREAQDRLRGEDDR